MTALPPLRDVIARHGLRANKALGQNFLLDTQLLARIAAIPGDVDGQRVYEVGPGPGGLTRALLEAGAEVVAIERDDRCLTALDELSSSFPGCLTVVSDDAMAVKEADIGVKDAHIVANLPYNIGTALLVRWLTLDSWPPWWRSLTLMFQEEVARRIVAKPGESAYGRLSVLAQWRSTAKIALKVHRSAFVPPPKVMSAVVHIRPDDAPEGVSADTIGALTQAAFGQRRKMLRQSLKSSPNAVQALEDLGIDGTRRAETLSVEDYIGLARALDVTRA
ncbi:16S rRNA (adenine(1518)-N(6)/adenine(1519)-N(6))-dimethyltransferase RsmA [Parasphingopyxis sp.]|uniref:16S rRNA (adenine(1518)-N(6)/adenine(1519)-N(6))- dimethyltransferase RsmA n=1 Tax=Parasphingopyxis sp. TaxID=1920299 RepID=UPI0026311DE8|nr:16S rRNA (adenine(1518)-N(6)/adenine(1519)-N(6))-dimethyltransferase RsmA [Parasphingopyxis sp.]